MSVSYICECLKSTKNDELTCAEILPAANEKVWSALKEDYRWNLATHHLRRTIDVDSPREIIWMKTVMSWNPVAMQYEKNVARQFLEKINKYKICRILGFYLPTDSSGSTLWITHSKRIKNS